jgi:aminoglycoside phosphotransferase (APT) family kinase protein
VDNRVALLPPDLRQLLTAHLGAPPRDLAPTFGGFSNLTIHATFDGRPCVIKAATSAAKRADIRREATLLPHLHAAGLPVPERLALVDDGAWTASVTVALPGQNGLQVLADGAADLAPIFTALGRVLAAAHTTAPPALHPDLDLHLRSRAAQPNLTLIDAPPERIAALQNALIHPVWQSPTGLIHGDCGLHNLLWSGEELRLLDWEWAGVGPALLDLAWLRWTMSWRKLPDELWSAFLNGYGPPHDELDTATQQALALGQIGLILARVADQPAARAEWLRRAEWTEVTFGGAGTEAPPISDPETDR